MRKLPIMVSQSIRSTCSTETKISVALPPTTWIGTQTNALLLKRQITFNSCKRNSYMQPSLVLFWGILISQLMHFQLSSKTWIRYMGKKASSSILLQELPQTRAAKTANGHFLPAFSQETTKPSPALLTDTAGFTATAFCGHITPTSPCAVHTFKKKYQLLHFTAGYGTISNSWQTVSILPFVPKKTRRLSHHLHQCFF